MNIIEAIHDKHLFRGFLGPLDSWQPWLSALRCLYGLPIGQDDHDVITECTGRDPDKLPEGFTTALFLTGRRSGKSRIAALAAAYEAALSGRERALSAGEIGLVAVVSPTRFQSRIVKSYIRAAFDSSSVLQGEIADETRDGFRLRNGVEIQILTGDFRAVRGFTLLAAVVDEVCFFHLAEEGRVRNDTELIQAVRPGLATSGGRLLCIGSPYAERGWAYGTWKRCWANDKADTLVWRAPSRTMNETLPQSVVDAALVEDLAAAKAEYLAEWRSDVAAYLPREVIEQFVVAGRVENWPRDDCQYIAFADISGGRADDAALAIGHRENDKVVLDFIKRWKPPFSPDAVVGLIVECLQRYRVRRVVGDNYAAEFVNSSFHARGIKYMRCEQPKSELYRELLPRLCSGGVELLDDEVLISQLAGLERRTRSGGRDTIDHPPGAHDDVANVCAGVAACVAKRRKVVRAL